MVNELLIHGFKGLPAGLKNRTTPGFVCML